MAKFLLDGMLFNFFPYWAPAFAACLLYCTGLLLISKLGPLYGSIYISILYMVFNWSILQTHIVDHRSRIFVGAYAGLWTSTVFTFWSVIGVHVGIFYKLCVYSSFAALLHLSYKFHGKRAKISSGGDRSLIAYKVVQSSPSEGPDEEAAEVVAEVQQTVAAATKQLKNSPAVESKFVKDSETGMYRRTFSPHAAYAKVHQISESKTTTRKRTLGPRLCGACVADKRCISVTANYMPKKINNPQTPNHLVVHNYDDFHRRYNQADDYGNDSEDTLLGNGTKQHQEKYNQANRRNSIASLRNLLPALPSKKN